MNIHPGEFVYATKGRDLGKCFLVIARKDDYLYLCDGKSRKVSNPKKKKLKHTSPLGISDCDITRKLTEECILTNKEIRCSLMKIKSRVSEQNC